MNPTSLDAITPNTLNNDLNRKDDKVRAHEQSFNTSNHPTVGSLTTSVDKTTHGLTGNPHSTGLDGTHHTGNNLTGHQSGNNLAGHSTGVYTTGDKFNGSHIDNNVNSLNNAIHNSGTNPHSDKVIGSNHNTGIHTTDNKLGGSHTHNNVSSLDSAAFNHHPNPHSDNIIGSNQNTGVLADNPVKYSESNTLDNKNVSFAHNDKVIGSKPNTSTTAGTNNSSLHGTDHTGSGLDRRHDNSTDIASHGKVVGGLENKHSVTSTSDKINDPNRQNVTNNIEGAKAIGTTNPSKLSHPVAGEGLESYPATGSTNDKTGHSTVTGDKVQHGHHTTSGLGAANGQNTNTTTTKHNTSHVSGQNAVPHVVGQNNNHHSTTDSIIPPDVKPSKVGGTLEKLKGSVQETVGKVLGSANLKESGVESKLEGQAKIEAAKLEKEQKQAIH